MNCVGIYYLIRILFCMLLKPLLVRGGGGCWVGLSIFHVEVIDFAFLLNVGLLLLNMYGNHFKESNFLFLIL